MNVSRYSHPILSCSEARKHEEALLKGEEAAWKAMCAVGRQLGRAMVEDLSMSRRFTRKGRALAIIGKGHNGGDALLALAELSQRQGCDFAYDLALAAEVSALKPNTRRALARLQSFASVRIHSMDRLEALLTDHRYVFTLDGLLGMSFRPPLREAARVAIDALNRSSHCGIKVAVDLPSGEAGQDDVFLFGSDFTYATGIFKRPLLKGRPGVIRYLDIGFFERDATEGGDRVLLDDILNPLRELRDSDSEKRRHGHLAILAGSGSMPGALTMSVYAAIRSGVGLVTVFAPESVVTALSVVIPEAMWKPWPESPDGSLALEGIWQLRQLQGKATALLMGPGMGTSEETVALMQEAMKLWDGPVFLDADALRPDVVALAKEHPLVLSPHAGEFKRLAEGDIMSDERLRSYAFSIGATVIGKGSSTRICQYDTLLVNATGNPVLARGGSGDMLAGLGGGLLAQFPKDPFYAAAAAVHWHGRASDLLAVAKGQTAVRSTDLMDFLSSALEDPGHGIPATP